jgi:hypothetical protein
MLFKYIFDLIFDICILLHLSKKFEFLRSVNTLQIIHPLLLQTLILFFFLQWTVLLCPFAIMNAVATVATVEIIAIMLLINQFFIGDFDVLSASLFSGILFSFFSGILSSLFSGIFSSFSLFVFGSSTDLLKSFYFFDFSGSSIFSSGFDFTGWLP